MPPGYRPKYSMANYRRGAARGAALRARRRRRKTAYKAAVAYNRTKYIELKHADLDATITADQAGNINSGIATVSVGDSAVTREGIRIRPMSWNIRYHIARNLAGAPLAASIVCRVLLIQNKRTAAVTPVVTDYLDTAALSAGSEILAVKNFSNRKQFRVLYDKTHCLSDQANIVDTGTTTDNLGKNIYRSVSIGVRKLKPIQFNEGADTYMYGQLSLLVICNVDNGCLFDFNSRVYYSDM